MAARLIADEPSPSQLSAISLWRHIGLLWLVSAATHVVMVSLFLYQPIALDDMFQYDMLGRSIAQGTGYRWYAQADWNTLKPYLAQFLDVQHVVPPSEGLVTTFRAPGYPLFLALIYVWVPLSQRFVAARLTQAIVISTLAPLTAVLALELGLRRRLSLISGGIVAFYPILLMYPVGLASENLFIPCVLLGVILLLRACRKPGLAPWIAAGLVGGASVLTRSVIVGGIVLAAGVLALMYKRRQAGWCVLVAFAVCLPWALRNSWVMKRPTFVETSFNYNLFVSYHPEGDGGFVSRVAVLPLNILDDSERDTYCGRKTLEFIEQDPWTAVERIGLRAVYFMAVEDRELIYFFSNDYFGPIDQPWLSLLYGVLTLPWLGVSTLAIIGMAYLPNRVASAVVVAMMVGYSLPHLFIIAEPRFHLVLVPLLTPFSVWGFAHVRQLFRKEVHDESTANT